MGLATTREKFLNVDMENFQYFNTEMFELAVYTSMGRRKGKKKNEDSCGFVAQSRDNVILIVSDGMGGHKMGDRASHITVSTIVGRSLLRKRLFKANDISQRIEKSHVKIKKLGVDAGATVVCAHLHGETIRFFCVGDSVGFLSDKNGNVRYKTIEHSVVGFATQAGIISEAEASQREDSNVILNCLGFSDSRMETSFDIEFKKGDVAFLCSDGVTDFFDSKAIQEFMATTDLQKAAGLIVEKSKELKLDHDSYDDFSFILAKKIS